MIGGRMVGIWLAYQLLPPQCVAMIAIGNDITFKNINEKLISIKGVRVLMERNFYQRVWITIDGAQDMYVKSRDRYE